MSETKNGAKSLFARMSEKSIERDEEESANEKRLAAMEEWLEQRLRKLSSRG